MNNTNKKPPQEETLDGFYDSKIPYITNKFNDKELLEIFPEARYIILPKIKEYKQERKERIEKIKQWRKKVKLISKAKQKDDFFVWFWAYAYPKYFWTSRVVEIDRYLYRLNRQKRLLDGKSSTNNQVDWEELKERAKQRSLVEEALPHLQKVRQVGNRIVALCPFHQEKTPSFFIYIDQSTFHCFGCQTHGDIIHFKMTIDNLSFKEAVKELSI